MRRDMDLIRTLLLRLEDLPMEMGDAIDIRPRCKPLAGIEADDASVLHHLELLRDEGFLDCPPDGQPMLGITFMGLTWRGHDLADAIRNDTIWVKTKEMASQARGWTGSLLLEFAKAIIKSEAGRHFPGLF